MQKLVEYKNEHGDCNPPNRSRLGRWAYTIRQSWKEMNGRYSNNTNWEPTENNDASNMNNDDNPGDDNNASGNNNNNSGIDTLAHAAAKTEEEFAQVCKVVFHSASAVSRICGKSAMNAACWV